LKTWHWFISLLILGSVLTVGFLGGHPAQTYPDTGTYLRAAQELVSGDFSVGQGRRTPGYPLFIVAVGGSEQALVIAQKVAGLLTSALLFGITMLLTKRPALAFAVGVSYLVNLQQMFQETALTTETLSTLSVAATVAALLLVMARLGKGQLPTLLMLALGVLAGFAILVRPQFIFFLLLLPVMLVYAVSRLRRPTTRSFAAATLGTAPALLMLLIWCAVVYVKVGYFTLSTQPGFGMVNHTIDYIELAPERYAVVRDVLIKTREARMAEVGHTRNTIWYALPEMQRVTGWSLPEASRQMQRMCTEMFIAYPGRYAVSLAMAWRDFWTVPIFWQPESVKPPMLGTALQGLWKVEHLLLRLANLAFVCLVVAVAVSVRVRRTVQWDAGLTAIAATVLLSSIVQALFDQGASSRYAIPTQALVVLVLMVSAARARQGRSEAG